MARNRKKPKTQQPCQVDSKKILDDLMEKCKLDAEKEKKRIEKQAEQRAEVEMLKKINLEEQAAFIVPQKWKKISETVKNSEKNTYLSSAGDEKVNCENSMKVPSEIDDDIWDEEYGTNCSNYQPAQNEKTSVNNMKQSTYQLDQENIYQQNRWGSHKENTEDSQYERKPYYTNRPPRSNKAQQGQWTQQSKSKQAYNQESKSYRGNESRSYRGAESNSYRGNTRNYQSGGKAFHSNKQQYRNINQREKCSRDSEKTVASNKSENFKNSSYHPSNSEAESSWDIPEWPDLNEVVSVLPKVNVWEERKAKQESIQQMAPHSNYEEEIMLEQALELSKRQAEEDERKQREIMKKYEQQQRYLEQNPECLKHIAPYSNVDGYEDDDPETKHRQARNFRVSEVSSTMINNQSISSYCNGARAKYKPTYSLASSSRDSIECPKDVWTDNEGECNKLDAGEENTEVKPFDGDSSPCEDEWETCIEDKPSHAEKADSKNIYARSCDAELKQHVSTDLVNHIDDIKGIANENVQICKVSSLEHEAIHCQNIKGDTWSLNEDFSQKCDDDLLHNTITMKNKATGMFQNIEFAINNGQHQLIEEKSLPIFEGKNDQNRNFYQETLKNEDPTNKEHTFNSLHNMASVKSSLKRHDELPVPQEEFHGKDASISQHNVTAHFNQDAYAKSLSTIEFDDIVNDVQNEALVKDVGIRESNNENVSSIGCSSVMVDVKKWVESTIVGAPHSKHDVMENKKFPSTHPETAYEPDASLKPQLMKDSTLPVANFSNQPDATHSPPIKPPVEVEVNFPYTLHQLDGNNNKNSDLTNSDNPNSMALPYLNASFNPAFMVQNPAMLFNGTMPSSSPVTQPSLVNPLDLQQMLSMSNNFFTQQFLLSQNYALQMYQQAAGLHGLFNAVPTGLIPPNIFRPVHTPTNLPHFPVNAPYVSTASTNYFTSRATDPFGVMTSLSSNSNDQYSVPNNLSTQAPFGQQNSDPAQMMSFGLPTGLCNNIQPPFDTKLSSDLMRSVMMNEQPQDNGVGIPPPKPPRQPKQNYNEVCPLIDEFNMIQNDRFSALGQGHSDY